MAPVGRLQLETATGSYTLGSGTPAADLRVTDYSAVGDIARTGVLGFAEAYMDARIETTDLRALLRWAIANEKAWLGHPLATLTNPLRAIWQKILPEKRHLRVVTMNDHYNLSTDFYEAWLDETMTYSSARFTHPAQPLTEAQMNKYRTVADHAGLESGMRVLEIGCGWGGFAAYAVGRHGCDVLAITPSEEQAAYAEKRIADAGLADRAQINVQDFRRVEGKFDAVVSIEMIESVDETHWPHLFDTLARSLSIDARAVMQVITIQDDQWERYRKRADFIQQYIFPGGQVPAPKVLRFMAECVGLVVEQVETFGLDYVRTLSTCRDRFITAWPTLEAKHGLDERFRRMWDLYLGLCEAGFRMGRTNVEQWVFTN